MAKTPGIDYRDKQKTAGWRQQRGKPAGLTAKTFKVFGDKVRG
jgi:hypothetical protein